MSCCIGLPSTSDPVSCDSGILKNGLNHLNSIADARALVFLILRHLNENNDDAARIRSSFSEYYNILQIPK